MNRKYQDVIKSFDPYLHFFLIGVAIIIVATYHYGNVQKFGMDHVSSLNDGWSISTDNEAVTDQSLPLRVDVERNELVTASKVLPETFKYPRTIRLRSSMADMSIFLDEEMILTNTISDNQSLLHPTSVSAWIMVDIPAESQGKVLKIVFSSAISSMTGRVNEVYYGTRSDLITKLLVDQTHVVGTIVVIFFISFFTFIVSFVVDHKDRRRLIYLALFAFSVGIWVVSEMDIMQLFTGNRYIVGSISYLFLPIATANLVLFFNEAVFEKYRKFFARYAAVLYAYTFVSILVQSFLGINYITMWPIFIVMVILYTLVTFALLLVVAFKGQKNALKYLLFIGILFLTTILESLMFLTGHFMKVGNYSSVGIAIFLLLLMIDTMAYVRKAIQKEGEAIYLREVAYKDGLIGCLNRSAFEKDIDRLLNDPEKKAFRLTMFDLNHLKRINDTLGHETGDEALVTFYVALLSVYKEASMCYRIGGDEFMVIDQDTSLDKHEIHIKNLKDVMSKMSREKAFHLQTAYGSGVYDHEQSFGEFKHSVDRSMYEEKSRQKTG